MTQIWIMFRSITHAQTASRILERGGVTAAVTRAPQGSNPKGCGYAVTVRRRIPQALELLREKKIPYVRIMERREDGSFEEVPV